MRVLTRLITLLSLAVLVAMPAFAQTTTTLRGEVTSGGAPLPGATIPVSSQNLQGTRNTVSGANGDYNFAGLPPGDYTIKFELSGMGSVTEKRRLALAQDMVVNADLKVSSVTEAITVTAAAPSVLETPGGTANVTAKELDKLPIARTVLGAVSLAPGVSSNGINGAFAISGAPSYDNVYLVNGTVVNEELRGTPDNLFIEDAIQETTTMPF